MNGTQTAERRRARAWQRLGRLDAVTVTAWYAVLTLLMTWPVCAHLTTRLPNDLGDPLFNCWVLKWNLDHLVSLGSGHLDAIHGYWNAGMFHPEPLALLYSDHLFALGVQALPAWLVTHDIVFCYNLLFLSTFMLSGLGAFLFVRQLTGSARAGFVAGLLFAFAPYRFGQLGHLQVLSSQWMPFVLYGLRLFFERSEAAGGAVRSALIPPRSAYVPLAGAAAALVAQNLSCGYYLVFFTPFVAAYIAWEMLTRGAWRSVRVWTALAAAGTAVGLACLPFLLKYQELRRLGFAPRPVDELRGFSADTFSYLRAMDDLWIWRGALKTVTKPEAFLFPGLVAVALALVALACLAAALRRRSLSAAAVSGWRLATAAVTTVAGIAALELARFELFAGRRIWRVREAWPWLSDVRHVFLVIAACAVLLVVLSPRARAVARAACTSGRVFFAALFLAAAWLSFGPNVTTADHGIAADTLYAWLYRTVPGFDGLRVPARFAMLGTLFLAVLAGYGVAAIERAGRVGRGWMVPALSACVLIESACMPLAVTRLEWPRLDGRPGAVSVADLGPLYNFIRKLPAGTVVAEFPFGGLRPEIRAVFLSIGHGHPIVNGYSGGFPAAYNARAVLLMDPFTTGDRAWRAILDSGATCLVVHEWAFQGGNGPAFGHWLESHGAIPIARFRSDTLFQVSR